MYREQAGEQPVVVVALASRVYGLDAKTGVRLWQHELQGGYPIELLVYEQRVIACTSQFLTCIAYPSGAMLGSVEVHGQYPGRSSMVVQDGRIYVARGGELSCYSLEGQLLWFEGFKGGGVDRMAVGFPGNVRQIDERGSST